MSVLDDLFGGKDPTVDYRSPGTAWVEDILFPGPATGIPSDTLVPAGTNVVACWPPTTVLPVRSVLRGAAAKLGEPFEMAYLETDHQGVSLSEAKHGWEIQKTFADVTGGNAPVLFASSVDYESAVDYAKAGTQFTEGIGQTFEDIRDAAAFGANAPRYLLIGGLVLGGVLIVGYGVYRLARMKK